MRLSNYYYNNLINFIGSLFEDGYRISPIFGEKILENSLKLDYFREMILKYNEYFKKRINDIIFGMIYFMIKDEEFLFYIKNKADEIYMKDSNSNYIFDDSGNKITYIEYYKKYCKNIGDLMDGISKVSYPQITNYTNGDLKQFSNSLKQFLKSKRALSK